MNPILAKDIKAIVEKKAWELNPNVLDAIFSHNTTATLGGAGLGAGIGALTNKKDRKGGALMGAGIGGLAGLGGSMAAPEVSQNMNEFLVKNLVRKPAGRVLTNILPPIGYDQKSDLENTWKNNSLSDIAKSVWKDKPVYEDDMLKYRYDDRDVPYRKAFDLPGRYATDVWKENSDGSLAFNKDSKRGLMDLLEVLDPRRDQHSVMKNYHRQFNPDDSVSYKDVWDWKMNPNNSKERINNPQNLARYFIDRISNPAVIQGNIEPDQANLWRSLTKIPHPSMMKKSGILDTFQNGLDSWKKNVLANNPGQDANKVLSNYTHNKIQPVLDKVFSPTTSSTLLGTGGGMVAGALANKKNRLRGAMVGGLAGAGAGYGFDKVAPEQSKGLYEYMMDRTIRPAVGRVLTNVVEPRDYSAQGKEMAIKFRTPQEVMNSIVKDEPIYKMDSREPVWRRSFNLPPRAYNNLHTQNPDGTTAYNPNNPTAFKALQSMYNHRITDTVQNPDTGMVDIQTTPNTSRILNDVYQMGNYNLKSDTNGNLHYSDTWDFDLHPHENAFSKENAMRMILDKIIKKQRMSGTIDPALAARLQEEG